MAEANWQDVFPELTPEEIHERVATRWDLYSWAYPLPKFHAVCPWCGADELHARTWGFHDRHPHMERDVDSGRVRYRCDVSMKCCFCGNVQTWGVAVPDEWWLERMSWSSTSSVTWRDALRIARDRGFTSKDLPAR
jgi:hypothetical protein